MTTEVITLSDGKWGAEISTTTHIDYVDDDDEGRLVDRTPSLIVELVPADDDPSGSGPYITCTFDEVQWDMPLHDLLDVLIALKEKTIAHYYCEYGQHWTEQRVKVMSSTGTDAICHDCYRESREA